MAAPRPAVSVKLEKRPVPDHLREVFDAPLCMAFQPIVDLRSNSAFAYEALVRGEAGEGAETVMRQVTEKNRDGFDNACRRQSLIQASALRMQETGASLALNVSQEIIRSPSACVDLTLQLAETLHFPLSCLILEIAEFEPQQEQIYLNHLIRRFRGYGIRTAIADYGKAPSGAKMLEDCEADIVKIAMSVVRNLNITPGSCATVESIVQAARGLDMLVVAEGVGTAAEYETLCKMGVYLMQGYFFALPALSRLPPWTVPDETWESFQLLPNAGTSACQPPSEAKVHAAA